MAKCGPVCDFPASFTNLNQGTTTGMGLGKLGGGTVTHKRKFRFIMEILYCEGTNLQRIPGCFVKTASRPDLTIEDTEINYLNGRTWIPGKVTFEPITVTYYDVNQADNYKLLSWIASVYDFTDSACAHMNSKRSGYAGTGFLSMLDGCGNIMEIWEFKNLWPTSVKFGDVAMDTSDVCEIELTLRYDGINYTDRCNSGKVIPCPCSPC